LASCQAELLNRRLLPHSISSSSRCRKTSMRRQLGVVNGLDEDVRAREAADERPDPPRRGLLRPC
jgi:hypothetical protein